MSTDKFHCTNGHCLTDCVLSSIDYDRSFPPGFCPHSGINVWWQKCEPTEKNPTVFDRITASPEVLAPKFVYEYTLNPPSSDGTTKLFRSLLTGRNYYTEPEAIAATVAKLKGMEDEN